MHGGRVVSIQGPGAGRCCRNLTPWHGASAPPPLEWVSWRAGQSGQDSPSVFLYLLLHQTGGGFNKKVFEVDPLFCPDFGGVLKIVSFI